RIAHQVARSGDRHGPDTLDLATLAWLAGPALERGGVDVNQHVGASVCRRRACGVGFGDANEGVEPVGISGLAPPVLPGFGEDLARLGLETRHDPGAIGWGAVGVQMPGAARVRPRPQPSCGMRTPMAFLLVDCARGHAARDLAE